VIITTEGCLKFEWQLLKDALWVHYHTHSANCTNPTCMRLVARRNVVSKQLGLHPYVDGRGVLQWTERG
jgi:hypothetical protein